MSDSGDSFEKFMAAPAGQGLAPPRSASKRKDTKPSTSSVQSPYRMNPVGIGSRQPKHADPYKTFF